MILASPVPPVVVENAMQKAPRCGFCGVSVSEHVLMKCSGCLNMYYCGREHQRFDWKKHKPMCRMQQQNHQIRNQKPHAVGSCDSQLGASLQSEQSLFDSNPYLTSGILGKNVVPDLPLGPALPTVLDRPSVIRSTAMSTTNNNKSIMKQECISLTAIPERRKTYGVGDFNDTQQRTERKMSIDPQNPPNKFFLLPRLDSEETLAPPDFLHIIGLTDKIDHTLNKPLNLALDPRFRVENNSASKHAAFVLRIRKIAQYVAGSLNQYGWCVLDNFLGSTHGGAVMDEVSNLYLTPGKFSDGQLVKTREGSSSHDIRSDKIYWFDNRVDQGVNIGFFVSMIDSVVFHLSGNIPPYKINGRSRAMIACYPGSGTKYVKHVDNPDKDGRCVTSIYYLNQDWDNEVLQAGGVLRLFPESSLCPIDVEPIFDRLLFFWSDRRNPHEVLPSQKMRYAITIWYFDADERTEAMAREQNEKNNGDGKECVSVFAGVAVASTSALENHVAKVALNTPPHFGSVDSVNSTILSSTGSIPSLYDLTRFASSRSNSFTVNDPKILLDTTAAAAAFTSLDDYMMRRATLDLGHLSRNQRPPEPAYTTFMATVPETRSPENELA